MSIPSSIYETIGETTIGTENYYYTDKLSTLVPYGGNEFEKSILCSAWNKRLDLYPDLCTNNQNTNEIPVKIFTFDDNDIVSFNLSDASSARKVSLATRLQYNPQITPKKATMSNVFTNSSEQYTFGDVGANSTVYSSLTSTQKGNYNFYRDIQIDKFIIAFPTIKGFLKNSENKEIINIDITDFIENPDNYYISSMISGGVKYLWNGTQYVNSSDKISSKYYTEFDGFKGFKVHYPYSTQTKKVSMYYSTTNSAFDKGNISKNIGRCSYPTETTGSIAYITNLQIGNYRTGGFGERYSPISYDDLELICDAPAYYVETKPTSQANLLKEEWQTSDNAIHNIKYYSIYSTSAVSSSDRRYILNDFYAEVTSYVSGRFIYDYLSGIGCYFVNGSLPTGITPETIDTFDNIYLGEIDDNGYTTLNFLNGKSLLVYDGNKHGNTNNDNFNPNIIPDSSDDDIDDMPLGYDILDNGMIKYYQITVGDLIKVATVISNMSYATTIKAVWDTLNDTTETDKLDTILNTLRTWGVSADNLMPSIVSLKSFGISTSNFLASGGTKSESIVLNGVDCETNTVRILASSMSYHIGDYTINGKYGDAFNPHFLDYNPYTKIEIYIPYCGTVELPSKCMYNTINVYILGDIFSGSCVGVVKCKGAIVATKSGMIGVDTPLTSNGNGLKSNALMTGVMNSIGVGAQTILSGATGNMGGIISGATVGMSNISQQIQAGNENYTRMIGNVSDKCAWALPHQATIKIVHPIANYGDNYDRTYGKPVCKSRTLSAGDGFTIIDNPIINGNMTLAEKTEIENYLRSGVIL